MVIRIFFSFIRRIRENPEDQDSPCNGLVVTGITAGVQAERHDADIAAAAITAAAAISAAAAITAASTITATAAISHGIFPSLMISTAEAISKPIPEGLVTTTAIIAAATAAVIAAIVTSSIPTITTISTTATSIISKDTHIQVSFLTGLYCILCPSGTMCESCFLSLQLAERKTRRLKSTEIPYIP